MLQLEGKELVTVDQVFDMVNFKVEREQLINSKGVNTGYDTIFRKKDGITLGVVSRDYQLITHERALSQVMDLLEKKRLPKIKPVRIQVTHEGSRMFAQFRLNKKSELGIPTVSNPKVGDAISPGFVITNSYDRSLKFGAESFIYRLACSNGMTVRDDIYSERKRHTKSLDLDIMVERFVENFERFEDDIVPQVAALTTQILNPVSLEKELNMVPSWIQGEAIQYLEEGEWIRMEETDDGPELEVLKDISRWDLLNSYTYVMSHSITQNPKIAMELNRKISERFLGNAA